MGLQAKQQVSLDIKISCLELIDSDKKAVILALRLAAPKRKA